jgi:bis(5'-nucleosidyl)-tetraphosphatase
MIDRKSVGAVVFRKEGGQRRYLLLHYSAGHWDFVKGGVEKGEEEEDTLARECREETGITGLRVVQGFRDEISYFFREKGSLVKKHVVFFAAETGMREVRLSHEHQGYEWLPLGEAAEKLTYKNAKQVLAKADAFLNAGPREEQETLA